MYAFKDLMWQVLYKVFFDSFWEVCTSVEKEHTYQFSGILLEDTYQLAEVVELFYLFLASRIILSWAVYTSVSTFFFYHGW
jgi:hypothetical protein